MILRNYGKAVPGLFPSVVDVAVITCLIYYATVCICRLKDGRGGMHCKYLSKGNREWAYVENCLPASIKVHQMEIASLVCAFVIA